jgi:hypothetical protein
MSDTEAEIVFSTDLRFPETDLLVDSADGAIQAWQAAGGSIARAPFDLPTGRCAVVRDLWGNCHVVLDQSKVDRLANQPR